LTKNLLWFGLLPLAPAFAQGPAPTPTPNLQTPNLQTPAVVPPSSPNVAGAPLAEDEVGLSAARLDYDDNQDVVVASGEVRMQRNGYRLRADKVTYNRTSGQVIAEGRVVTTSPGGDTVYGDRVELTDTLKDGVVDNILLVLADGGRLAATRGSRKDGVETLEHAAYTPCRVADDSGCPKEPLWKITAVKVVHDPNKKRIYYRGARLHLAGLPIPLPPLFSHPDGSGSGGYGLLEPNFRYSRVNGAELSVPYYFALAPNRDLTITPHVFSKVAPAIAGQYRSLSSLGAWQVAGMATYSSRQAATVNATGPSDERIRGYIDANGRFQLDPEWTVSGSLRVTTDKTFLRRYDISRDDRLRSVAKAERITPDSYLSIAGWAFQGLRTTDRAGQTPIALPAIDFRQRIDDPLLGGKIELQANSLAILRTQGQDTQRAFAGARWDLRRITSLGQELTLTGYARADAYHTGDVALNPIPAYRGDAGWNGRGVVAAAADLRWPLVGPAFGGTQRITPRVQIVASPPTRNLSIPNEDARAIDLEDSNLFALNRFAGYDRWEDGNRITYGGEYALDLPGFSARAIVGQSYRLSDKPSIFPVGTGLSGRFSDIVGRATIRYRDFISYTQRFRLDKDSLRIRRNEADVTLGTDATYVTAGYLRLNRDIAALGEDLRDREELRIGGRLAVLRHWSVFGSTVIDFTGKEEDPLSVSDGYEPIRHRLGFAYEDECLTFGLTWRRDYSQTGDARRGNTYVLSLALKNLGR
jgi:LPS-assembly protein